MADKKISALPSATLPLAGTEIVPLVQGGVTSKAALADLTAGRAVSAASVNKVVITAPATASTLTIADSKTLAVNDNATLGTGGLTLGNSGGFTAAASKVLTASNTLTLAGTDTTTHTFPTTSSSVARTDAAQVLTGNQSLTAGNIVQVTAAKGFDFSANTPAAGMTSQLLNWYEEGTWTPTDGSGASLTFTLARGTYVRIGRMVQIMCLITYPITASVAGTQINGLPFNCASTYFVGFVPTQDTGQNYAIRIDSANSYMTVRDNAQTQILNFAVSGKSFYITFTYQV